jgi:hypothetical protein
MDLVEDKKALHVRTSVDGITKGKIVAAELQTSLGEIVSQALKFYSVLHAEAKNQGIATQAFAKILEEKLISNKEKTNGEKTGKKLRRKRVKTENS